MDRLIPAVVGMIVVPPLVLFWGWMFWDMIHNDYLPRWPYWDVAEYDSLRNRQINWTLAFVFLNVFAAAIYYFTDYRRRH